ATSLAGAAGAGCAAVGAETAGGSWARPGVAAHRTRHATTTGSERPDRGDFMRGDFRIGTCFAALRSKQLACRALGERLSFSNRVGISYRESRGGGSAVFWNRFILESFQSEF